jgi:chromosome condensin MukBEF MukE localization factor
MNQAIRAYKTFQTNIIGLPEGEYVTESMYTDAHAWVVLGRTAKTLTVAKVLVKRNLDWKPEFIAGGFAGHCVNNSEQTWLFDRISNETKVLRLVKSRYTGSDMMWGYKGEKFIANGAVEMYDYNF